MNPIGIDMQTVFALPPLEHLRLAAELGCSSISTGLTSFGFNPQGYPPSSLRDDAPLRREVIAAMADLGVVIGLGEGCNVRPLTDVRDLAADLDVMQELGVRLVNTVSLDPDLDRSFDQFATLAEMVEARDMRSSVELCPILTVDSLETALAAVRHAGRDSFGLLIDTLHFHRSGARPADLAALDPALISYIQLCDGPLTSRFPQYSDETMERMVPGDGELPLAEILALVPADVIVSVEVPQRGLAEAGVGPRERAARCVDGTRRLLADTAITA